MDHLSRGDDSCAGLSLKTAGVLTEQTVCCETLLSTSPASDHLPQILGTETVCENLNMDHAGLLTLLLVLNLSGAFCAVVQWPELNEAKVG